jgi:preprotein translocase subunit SecY
MSLPSTIEMMVNPADGSISSKIFSLFTSSNPVYIVLYVLLIFVFSYFYAAIQFNPIEIANNLKKNGGFIPGFRPGRPTSDFITKALGKVTFLGAIFLSIVAAVPLLIGALNTSLSNVALGGTSVLILVGVALETVRQLESQLMMRNYKGFLE